ncbi:MAG: hypothetical protein QXT37_05075 [Thermofilaceae archaeon]
MLYDARAGAQPASTIEQQYHGPGSQARASRPAALPYLSSSPRPFSLARQPESVSARIVKNEEVSAS